MPSHLKKQSLKVPFKILCQEKEVKNGMADTKVAEERESWQEEEGAAMKELKVQRPSFDMLQTLQWTG